MRRAFDDVFDQALVFHGFTDYMRDYEVLTYSIADPQTGIKPSFDRYLFRLCVRANVSSTVAPDIWQRSLDERLIEHETGKGVGRLRVGGQVAGALPRHAPARPLSGRRPLVA